MSEASERVEAEQQLSPTMSNATRIFFSVKDTGIGMSETEMGRLFQAYQQANDATSKQFGGTGLGLAISRECCRLLGGDLSVESKPNEGAVFTAELPLK